MDIEGKDLCFLDTETTGLDTRNDRIVKISIVKVKPDGTKEERSKLFNPQIEISEEATKIHGITNEMVKDEPAFGRVAKGLLSFIGNSVIVTYRGNRFDLPLLYNEFLRNGLSWDYSQNLMVDTYELWSAKETRRLQDAFKHFTGNEVDENRLHDSDYDTELLMATFKGQIKKYYGKEGNISQVALESNYGKYIVDIEGKFYADAEGVIRFNFGNARDKSIDEAVWQLEYILMGKYSENTKMLAQVFLDRVKANGGTN